MDLSKLDIPRKPHIRRINGKWKVVNESGFQSRFRYPHENKKFYNAIAWCKHANRLSHLQSLTQEQLIAELLDSNNGDQS